MSNEPREVWITGTGMVSCFGEGAEETWNILAADKAPTPVTDSEKLSPYTVHPMPEMDWSQQISKRGDVRQMENWQRLGTYTAGLALDDAGIKGNEELLSSMDLVVAAGGGERDVETDNSILAEAENRNDRDMLINERLPVDLRPTLFLAQLSNLLAGNISIVHKVTGSSRTYMGEESAGVTVIENAAARIRSGSSTHALIGGSFHADRVDAILPHELGNTLSHGGYNPVLARQGKNPGMNLGSGGAFLVLEEAEHARARGATPYAKLSSVKSAFGSRAKDVAASRLAKLMESLGTKPDCVISGASGTSAATALEEEFLQQHLNGKPVRHFHSMVGQLLEGSFPAGILLAALALKNNGFYPPFEAAEKPADTAPSSILVTSIGHQFGEALAMVEKA